MRLRILVALVALAGLLVATSPARAHGPLGKKYLSLYHRAADKHGARAPGRNIVKLGLKGRAAHRSEVRTSIAVLTRMVTPAVSTLTTSSQVVTPVASAAAPVSGGLPDCTWRPESGGSYTASNPSGAYGKYQLMPVHYGAGGVCAGMGKSPSEQEVCARRVFASSGAGAWVNC